MLDLSYRSASRLSFREFRELAWKCRREIEIAQVPVGHACEAFAHVDWAMPEQCDFAMLSVRTLRETTQEFSLLLHMTTILPYSIWSMRYSLIRILCNIDKQMNDLVLQLRVFRNASQESSGWLKAQQHKIRSDLETLLEDSNDSVINIGLFIDQATFIESRN